MSQGDMRGFQTGTSIIGAGAPFILGSRAILCIIDKTVMMHHEIGHIKVIDGNNVVV